MQLIEKIPDLEQLAAQLANEPLIAADTEAAGYHRYDDSLCLVQLSTRTETWLVDTLALGSLNPIAELFADPGIEILFHDADFDLRLLDRDFGIYVRGLFDTKIAARFTGARAFGLASLLEGELGLKLEKKYQRADWAKRPLPPEMLEYAAMDTRYLAQLRDILKERLEAQGRLAWAEEEFRLAEQQGWEPPEDADMAFLRLKNTRDLGPRSLAALREVYEWREDVAREMPEGLSELERVGGMSRGNLSRWGEALLAGVDRARSLPEQELPERPRPTRGPPRDPEVDRRTDQLKAVRAAVAQELHLEPGFLIPRWQLEEIARAEPRSTEELAEMKNVRRWQIDAMGERLLDALGK